MSDQYPHQLAKALHHGWPAGARALPSTETLGDFLSTCYQASQLREEGRPITFRLLLGDPRLLPMEGGPPDGLQVLQFERPIPFHANALRRLTPAAEFYRAMLGASCSSRGIELWGMVHTGADWSRAILGGRARETELPECLVVHVRSPGELSIYCGSRPLATLRGGRIEQGDLDVFTSRWLPSHFADVRTELIELHERARAASDEPWAELDPEFVRILAQHVMRRTISVMRQQRHGGTILFLPASGAAGLDDRIQVKYAFLDSDARRRFRFVMVETLNALARSAAATGRPADWDTYSASTDPQLVKLDEAIFEIGHLFADLSSVDGALVLNQRFELLGFGAEISGTLPKLDTVLRALDLGGTTVAPENVDSFGTRHRSVFRLCAAHPEVVAIVVSQDGQVRFVKRFRKNVVYFNHRVLGAL